MAVEDGGGGRLGVELVGDAEGGGGVLVEELLAADLGEEGVALAERDGDGDDGIPDDVAESAQAGEGGGDAIPVGGFGGGGGRADGGEAAGGERDGSAVVDVESEAGLGSEGLGQGDDGFT